MHKPTVEAADDFRAVSSSPLMTPAAPARAAGLLETMADPAGRTGAGRPDNAPMRVLATILAIAVAVGATLAFLFDLSLQTAAGLTNGKGRPFGDDFVNYWTGAHFALTGRAASLYDQDLYHAAQEALVGAPLAQYHFSYPPVAALLLAP